MMADSRLTSAQLNEKFEYTTREESRNQSNITRHSDDEMGSTKFVSIHGPYLPRIIPRKQYEVHFRFVFEMLEKAATRSRDQLANQHLKLPYNDMLNDILNV